MTPVAMAQLHALCFVTPRPWNAAEFSELLASRGVFSCATETGFAIGRVIADEAELLTLAVHPDFRRTGLGARLLDDFERDAARRGAEHAFLEVAADNSAALGLYQQAKFEQVGCRPNYYHPPAGPPVNALILRKPLPQRNKKTG